MTSLIMITGLPGTGKTTFAQALADKLNIPSLNSDQVRHEMGKRGQYDEASKKEVYGKLLFQYYKLYRANVRLKVSALKAMQEEDPNLRERYLGVVEDYFQLIIRYLQNFQFIPSKISSG